MKTKEKEEKPKPRRCKCGEQAVAVCVRGKKWFPAAIRNCVSVTSEQAGERVLMKLSRNGIHLLNAVDSIKS